MATDFSAEIERLRHTYASIAAVTDPEALRARIAELRLALAATEYKIGVYTTSMRDHEAERADDTSTKETRP